MPNYDPDNLHLVSIDEALERVEPGWIAQFRGRGPISRLIQYATGGPHSHSGLIGKRFGVATVIETRERVGGREIKLRTAARQDAGQIDVFSFDEIRWPRANPLVATHTARLFANQYYGWAAVLGLAARKVPGLWRLLPITCRDDDWGRRRAPFCSHLVSLAWQTGGVDPVPRCPNWLVSPNDLTRSLFFRYEFSIEA